MKGVIKIVRAISMSTCVGTMIRSTSDGFRPISFAIEYDQIHEKRSRS